MFKIRHLTLLILAASALLLNTSSYAANPKEGAKWSYHGDLGPQNWGKLDSEYKLCTTGKEQSPINITNAALTHHNLLKINYGVTAAQATYNTTTTLNIHDKKTLINDGRTLQINVPQNTGKEYITANGKTYRLVEFHFHSPSENLINGKHFPIEIHFVNQSADGKLAMLGVMLQQGKYNPKFEEFIDELPSNKKALKIANKILITIPQLLPSDKTYYSFNGSLTTPPCSEDVKWFVLATPLEVSEQQLDKLYILMPGNNNRPTQALNGRAIIQAIAK